MDDKQTFAGLDAETRESIAAALWLPELRADALPPGVAERLASPKNSNAAFAERMRARLRYLLDHPDSFMPSLERRYQTLIDHSDSLSPHQAYAMSTLLRGDASKGYERIPPAANLRFPFHHGEQLQTQVGWYFFVGSCTGSNGKEYGVELMFWRYALLPVPAARAAGLNDVENQLMELQFAISEAGDRHYQAVPYVVAGTTGLLEFGVDAIALRMGRNGVEPLQAGSVFPLRLQARGTYKGEGGPVDLGVDLVLTEGKGVLLQGADGCEPCCAGVGTLYYSLPALGLDTTRSRLTLKGEEVTLTGGRFWFDHQWGTGMVPPGNPRSHVMRAVSTLGRPGAAGWDWFEAQFDSNQEITLNSLHSPEFAEFYQQTGPTPPGTMSVQVKGKYMDPDGKVTDASGTLAIPEWIKSVDTPDPAQYWPTDTWYPNRWEFSLGAEVPEEIRRFSMRPIVPGGQSGFFAFAGHYSEGAVYLLDEQDGTVGRGFAESVQYADTAKNMMALAGLPTTPEMQAIFAREEPSLLLKARSVLYTLLHRKELTETLASCVEHGLASPDAAKAKPAGKTHH